MFESLSLSGTMYWKLDEDSGKVELDYPRDIQRVWRGVGYDVDTAFQWKDGKLLLYRLFPIIGIMNNTIFR